jgi:hypothetical protein
MLPIQVISDRFRAMYHVAQVIQSAWTWTVMSVSEMGSNLASLRSMLDTMATAETDMLDARESLDAELAAYRVSVRAYLRVAKLRYKSSRTKYNLVKPLRMSGTGRDSTIMSGGKAEKVWKKIDQAFVPVPGVTYVATHDCGVRCVQFQDDYSMKETEWRDKVEAAQDKALELDRANIEWYATATTVFPAGTRFGDLIRSMVPTNNSTVQPVEQAVIDAATSPAAGQVRLEFHAPHATSYKISHKAPGAEQWVSIAEDVDGLIYLVTGLTSAGEHRFQVAGHNSTGDGPASTEAVVEVAVAAVA